MDNLTHAALGAALGSALGERSLGPRVLVWGAVAGNLPDLDILAIPFLGPLAELRFHRGVTHALWFCPLVGAALGLWAARRGRSPGDARAWMAVLAAVVIAHPLLDAFTSYGTLLWWPFSDRRHAWDGIAIIDPFYTVPLLLALLAGRVRPALRPRLCAAALLATTLLLAHGVALDHQAEARVAAQLSAQGVTVSEVRAYPTLLQPWLRRVVARGPDGVRVGLISEFTGGPFVGSSFVPAVDRRIDELRFSPEGELFQWFSHGQTAARVVEEPPGYRVEIEDLRYGVPGPPDHGLWGIRARFDASGRRLGAVERFDRRPADAPALLRLLLRATFLPGN